MSDSIIIQPVINELTVTEDVNQVVVSSVGVQGPAGATGAKGDTGDQGPSGVIAVTAPITNSGTSTSANIGVSAGSTSTAGVLQLTDSTSSTSTTTAATPNAVKTAYDLANSAIPKDAWDWLFSQSSTAIDTVPRLTVQAGNQAAINGSIFFMPIVPIRDFTVSNLSINCISGKTDVSGTTVRKLGIYTLSGTTMTLVASTANDSTIGTANATVYTRSLTASYSVTAGTTYYIALICYNTGGTFNAPTFSCTSIGSSSLAAVLPRLAFRRGSQTDLASSVDVTSVSTTNPYWIRST
jgi:hypothetical protein